MKVYPGTIRQTVRIFDELPEKLNNKPTVKAHTDGIQAAIESGPFSWRSALSESIGGTNQAPSYRRTALI